MGVVNDRSEWDLREALYRVFKLLRGSFLFSLIVVGVVLFALAVLINSGIRFTGQDGVIAAILGIFGISAVLFGAVGYFAFKAFQRM